MRWCAREFAGKEPFLHLIGDHLYVSRMEKGCAQRIVEVALTESCAISAVQATREGLLPNFGTVSGKRVYGRNDLYTIDTVIEKPTPTEAEQRLIVPGLRAGYYLLLLRHSCVDSRRDGYSGLWSHTQPGPASGNHLRCFCISLRKKEKYLALEMNDYRYNVGVKYGLLNAQLALALSGEDRDEVLSMLMEMLLLREHHADERNKA